MARWQLWAALVYGCTGLSAIAGQPADKRIEEIAAQSEAARRGHWGAHVVNLTTGEVVYARNESQFFLPASNTKLFTTALALSRLGPDYRFITRLAAPAGPDAAGVIRGDLRLVGGGDPTLSGRPVPYESKAPHGPALGPLDALAEQAWNSGLRRVEGSVIGDDSAYLWEPYPTGWAQDDTLFVYGAPVSALTLHDNAFTVSVRGGAAAGDPAMVTVNPTGDYWTISSRVATASTRQPLRLDRDAGSRTLTIWGALQPMQERSFSVAVDDPALYAAYAMREALARRGISVLGGVASEHRHATTSVPRAEVSGGGIELGRRQSPPMIEMLRVINKVSQNLHAEMVLREVGRARGAEPGLSGGLGELKNFLTEIGVPDGDYRFEDGSGLSRLNLVTPAAVTTLLRHMHTTRHKEEWWSLMPVGGVDGSLDDRFTRLKHGRVLAKTGTLAHTSVLGGYLENSRGEAMAFCLMVNNANMPGRALREFIDRVVTVLVE